MNLIANRIIINRDEDGSFMIEAINNSDTVIIPRANIKLDVEALVNNDGALAEFVELEL